MNTSFLFIYYRLDQAFIDHAEQCAKQTTVYDYKMKCSTSELRPEL